MYIRLIAGNVLCRYTNISILIRIMRTESLDEALAELAKHESFAKRNGFDHKEWFVKEYWIDEEHWDYDDPEDPQFYDLVGSVKYAHCDIIE